MKRVHLAIPGPTNVPEDILLATARQPLNHRGTAFQELLRSVVGGLQKVFATKNPVYILTSSGTGAMQAAASSCFATGDRVLVLVNGYFGERFSSIAWASGLEVETLSFEWGSGIDLGVLEKKLKKDNGKKIKGVFFQQNETSTGVLSDTKAILKLVNEHGALSVVDAISGLIAAPLLQDEWGADVVLAASQKAFMMPPGLAFVSVSERAEAAIGRVPLRDFYFGLSKYQDSFRKWQTPYTPNVNLFFGLEKSLDMILAPNEGMNKRWSMHQELSLLMREMLQDIGFTLLAEEACASPAGTAVVWNEKMMGFPLDVFLQTAKEYGLELAAGQGKLAGKIFRVAHFGSISHSDILTIAGVLAASFVSVQGRGDFMDGFLALMK